MPISSALLCVCVCVRLGDTDILYAVQHPGALHTQDESYTHSKGRAFPHSEGGEGKDAQIPVCHNIILLSQSFYLTSIQPHHSRTAADRDLC